MRSEAELLELHGIFHRLINMKDAPVSRQLFRVTLAVHDSLAYVLGLPCGESFLTLAQGFIELDTLERQMRQAETS